MRVRGVETPETSPDTNMTCDLPFGMQCLSASYGTQELEDNANEFNRYFKVVQYRGLPRIGLACVANGSIVGFHFFYSFTVHAF